MKLKRIKAKIRPMRGPVIVAAPRGMDSDDYLEFIGGMGFFIYEDPTDENLLIITDRTTTLGDYRKRLHKGELNWFDETYEGRMNEELDEYRW